MRSNETKSVCENWVNVNEFKTWPQHGPLTPVILVNMIQQITADVS